MGCFARSIERSEDIINRVFSKAEFWKTPAQGQLPERQKKVINCLQDEGPEGLVSGLTTKKYALMTHASRATAFRELDQMTALRILERIGQGRSVRYELMQP
jgi:Fic family protein